MTQVSGPTKAVVGTMMTLGILVAQVLAVGLFLLGVLVIL